MKRKDKKGKRKSETDVMAVGVDTPAITIYIVCSLFLGLKDFSGFLATNGLGFALVQLHGQFCQLFRNAHQ